MLSHKIKVDISIETDPEMEHIKFSDIRLLEEEDSKKKEENKNKAIEMLSKLKVVTAAQHYKQMNLFSKFMGGGK